MTLAELIVATGLASVVMAAMVSIVNSSLNLWTKGESARQAREASSAVAKVMAHDLRSLHGSPEGDFIVDWEVHDVERDGRHERIWPRLRFVRDASAREAAWIARRALAEAARIERDRLRLEQGDDAVDMEELLSEGELLKAAGVTRQDLALGQGLARDTSASVLLEVLYAIVPEGKKGAQRYSGRLLRAERVHRAGDPHVLLREDIFDRSGVPDLTLAKEVARGVLWMRPLMATQTTHILPAKTKEEKKPWTFGNKSPFDAATSWDAWRRGRPQPLVSVWNEPAAGMPAAGERPLLPRRIRLELEMQRAKDRERAPRLLEPLEESATSFEVTSGKRMSPAVGRFAMVGGEWMKILGVRGDRVTVKRAERLTRAVGHPSGTRLLFGTTVVVDLPIAMYEDDWRLSSPSGGSR